MNQANSVAYVIAIYRLIVENSLNAYRLSWTFATQYLISKWLSIPKINPWLDIEPNDYLNDSLKGVDFISKFWCSNLDCIFSKLVETFKRYQVLGSKMIFDLYRITPFIHVSN